jgi:pimeloyl-ACP methyl ester carboxylesterase
VVPWLERRGCAVRTVDLPSVGAAAHSSLNLSSDAALVRATAADIRGPVLLCGHSYGGMVISHAGTDQPNVTGLVYVCAFVPEDGQSLIDIGGGKLAPWIRTLDGGLTIPDPERTAAVFYGDCDAGTQKWANSQLRPQPAAAFSEPVPRPAWRSVRSTYVVCAQDMAMVAQLQRDVFAPRCTQVTELQASHSPFLSRPAEVAGLLAAAAAEV